jgi:hypothetical protein
MTFLCIASKYGDSSERDHVCDLGLLRCFRIILWEVASS